MEGWLCDVGLTKVANKLDEVEETSDRARQRPKCGAREIHLR